MGIALIFQVVANISIIPYVTTCTDFSGTVPNFNRNFRVPRRSFGTQKYTDFKNVYRILYLILCKKIIVFLFYYIDTCIDYIGKRSSQFDHIMIFAWSALSQIPDWKFSEDSAKCIAKQQCFDMESYDTALFDQFSYLKKFVTVDKIQSWDENSFAIDRRWVECFQHFAKKYVPYICWESSRIFSVYLAHQHPSRELFLLLMKYGLPTKRKWKSKH